jgi:hypothetical protein
MTGWNVHDRVVSLPGCCVVSGLCMAGSSLTGSACMTVFSHDRVQPIGVVSLAVTRALSGHAAGTVFTAFQINPQPHLVLIGFVCRGTLSKCQCCLACVVPGLLA